MTPITNLSEQPVDYGNALVAADTLPKLTGVVDAWAQLAEDARAIVKAMTADDFAIWRKGLLKERKGKFAGDAFAEKYGPVLMPEKMFRVAMVAAQYGVPWGLAYSRMQEAQR